MPSVCETTFRPLDATQFAVSHYLDKPSSETVVQGTGLVLISALPEIEADPPPMVGDPKRGDIAMNVKIGFK